MNDQTDLPPGLAAPARRALAAAGVTRLADVARLRRSELMALHGMGPKAARLVESAMREQGLAFRDEADHRA